MNGITSGLGPSPLQTGSRGMDSAPAAAGPSPAIDAEPHNGQGALSGHTVAVGDGQTTKRMQEGGETKALLTSASPAVGEMLTKGFEGSELKGRQVGIGDGQSTSLLQKAGAALRGVLSGLSNMLNALIDKITGIKFERSVTRLHGKLASDPLFACKPMNRWFNEKLPKSIPAPRGVCDQAVRDWSGEGVTINGKQYAGSVDGVTQAVEKLVTLCGGNEASAEWISRYANQQAQGAISKGTPELALGPNGEKGYSLTKGRPQYEMKSLGGGSIELTIRYQWSSDRGAVIHDMEPLDDPGVIGDKFEFSYGLKFDLPRNPASLACPKVSLSQAFQCKTS